MSQIKELTTEEIKRQYPNIYEILFQKTTSDRRPDESLHDYLTRKQIKCFCKQCRQTTLL